VPVLVATAAAAVLIAAAVDFVPRRAEQLAFDD
jgi:hypothetical protein